jgi:hypothetical protein
MSFTVEKDQYWQLTISIFSIIGLVSVLFSYGNKTEDDYFLLVPSILIIGYLSNKYVYKVVVYNNKMTIYYYRFLLKNKGNYDLSNLQSTFRMEAGFRTKKKMVLRVWENSKQVFESNLIDLEENELGLIHKAIMAASLH